MLGRCSAERLSAYFGGAVIQKGSLLFWAAIRYPSFLDDRLELLGQLLVFDCSSACSANKHSKWALGMEIQECQAAISVRRHEHKTIAHLAVASANPMPLKRSSNSAWAIVQPARYLAGLKVPNNLTRRNAASVDARSATSQ